jgi:hypothetical protein
MATATMERPGERTGVRFVEAVPFVGAGAFVLAGVWYWLIAAHVSVSRSPAPGGSLDAGLTRYYTWFAGTLTQERLDTALALVAFACLAATGAWVAARLETDAGRFGALLVGLGSVLWIAGNVMQLGGHRAVGLMATHGNPIETTNSIAFTIDMIDDAFELAAFAAIGVGMLAFAIAAARAFGRAWRTTSLVVAVVTGALAAAYVTGPDGLVETLLVVGAVVLLPVWLVLTGRALGPGASTAPSEDGSRRIA